MSALIDQLAQVLDSGVISGLASDLGVSGPDTRRVAEQVVPALIERLQTNMATAEGAESLAHAIASDQGAPSSRRRQPSQPPRSSRGSSADA